MTARSKILIAGIGNIFLGDDGFGSDVARRLGARHFPAGVRVADFGIRGMDLAYALSDGYDLAILIDSMSQGGPPGTLYTIEPELAALEDNEDSGLGLVDAHTMDPMKVLRLARRIGETCPRILLVGCEPGDLGGAEGCMELSQPVQAAVSEACALVESLVADFLEESETIRSVGRPVSAE